ncbi:MAG: radical SAM protein [Planctomycetes bacterium]|nr:radical SAM protein [Planctomycetota bacterium]
MDRGWLALLPASQDGRRWSLLQVESSIDCRLRCVMCPWHEARQSAAPRPHMLPEVWEAIVPHLPQARSIDFSGGGEPLLQPDIARWVAQAHAAGCETGLLSNGLLLDDGAARRLIEAGIDWIAVSLDGATRETYEAIRVGSDFARVCENVERLARLRSAGRPRTMINFVLMPENAHEMEGIVRLAAEVGADKIHFKQCDVIRGEHGRGRGLFAQGTDRALKKLEKRLARARRLARKLGLKSEAAAFLPRERAVCGQDPRSSLFIRHDGVVSACIGLAYGGPSVFFGQDVHMPEAHYGRLPGDDLLAIWEAAPCRERRERFAERARAYESKILGGFVGTAPSRYADTLDAAAAAMPPAPAGCSVCHYLHGV